MAGNSKDEFVVRADNLRKRYGGVEALRGVSLRIRKGEVFGLLGPNGAGKTTTIEILEGLRQPDEGTVTVCGLDPAHEPRELKQLIGAQLQSTVLPDKVRVEEALRLFAGFYRRGIPVERLLDRFGLQEKRRTFFEHLSGGQKQRLALALALVNDPELVLLDEPTVGLDAMLRRDIYGLIEGFREEERTLLLTTHYIEEAERLCDRVAIIDRGEVIAAGTPRELVQGSGKGTRLEVRLSRPASPDKLKTLEAVLDCRMTDGTYYLHAHPVALAVVSLIRFLEAEGNQLLDLHIAQPSLEDVFVDITGRRLED
ncbi:MAG TPA: ABC transporter ATP-binding protein [Terriglobia bacterium]|jgi:ABC-2 type transport system ATP-binding protein|nr:ABC transporter ATP-binding protein [Terriglobia bacterium]